jgi:RND family efflux transporter MFP subunit
MPDADLREQDAPHYETAPPPANRTLKIVAIVGVALLLVLAIVGILSRRHHEQSLKQTTDEAAVPIVSVFHPKPTTGTSQLILPGNVQAYSSAAVNARTNGYVRQWYADIGSRVKAGQLLAVIDAPEVEQQLAQAKADLQTVQANQNLAQTSATRWVALQKQDAVSQQETDERVGDLAARKAATNASAANVRRLQALIGFTRITAPFAGIVTSRATQIGQLVTSGNASAQPLFTVSDIRRVRIYVRVPQLYSAQVRPGMTVDLSLPEFAGRTFKATLTRTAEAVDQASGTELIELQAPNPDGALKPGAYAQAHFPIAGASNSVTIPASALVFRGDGTGVAIVDGQGRVTLKPVTIGVDRGSTLEITAGLTIHDNAIDSPPDALATGDHVRVQRQPAGKQGPGSQGGQKGGDAQG